MKSSLVRQRPEQGPYLKAVFHHLLFPEVPMQQVVAEQTGRAEHDDGMGPDALRLRVAAISLIGANQVGGGAGVNRASASFF